MLATKKARASRQKKIAARKSRKQECKQASNFQDDGNEGREYQVNKVQDF